MKKFCCVTLFILVFSHVITAQKAHDVAISSASVLKDEFPLFTYFTCSVNTSNAVELRWKILYNPGEGNYFIIERGSDGDHFETVSAVKITDTATSFMLTDNSPSNGTDFYRVKYAGKAGQATYSETQKVSLSADVDFKFYPNPVDKLLIIRTNHYIDIEVLDAAGGLKLGKQLQPGLQVINIASLERGSYILKITDKESNRVVSEQLLKN